MFLTAAAAPAHPGRIKPPHFRLGRRMSYPAADGGYKGPEASPWFLAGLFGRPRRG
jgi:hypothetical protein